MMNRSHAEQISQLFCEFFPDAPVVGSYVAGHILPGSGEQIQLYDAATGRPSLAYADAGAEVVAAAAEAATQAQKKWWAYTHAARGRTLLAVAQQIREQVERLARLESLSAGKPIRDCRGEVAKVAEMFEYYAGWTDKLYGDVIPVPTTHLNYTRREPLGTVLQITPWNAPIFTAGWQVAPAIAMGNAVLLKPSELTPFTSLVLARLAEQAGVPTGLINVLAGLGSSTGQLAMAQPAVQKVVFVGSPATGRQIASSAAQRLLPCVLELGGKSANIVFEDADLERACRGAQAAIFSGAGQSCVSGSRLLVQRSVHDAFVEMLVRGAQKIQLGQPADDSTDVGPICNARQFAHVCSLIESGVAEGATLATGGVQPGEGYFVQPTVLSGVNNAMTIARTEVFGPVVVVIPFDTEEEAIALANDTPFGLAGAVWTRDVARGHRMAAAIRAGTFWVNGYKTIHVASPFGGYGMSGYGRSSGVEALHEYTQVKSIWVETAADPVANFGYL
jgi:aldehyde dehydrogenase (NAD+)